MKRKLTITAALAAVAGICWFGGYQHGLRQHKPSADLESAVRAMEPSLLKANLLSVIGSHYAGADEELGVLLNIYTEQKMRQLTGGGDL